MTTNPTPPRPPKTWRRAALALSLSFALLLGVAGVAGALVWRHLESNITSDNSADGELRPSSTPSTARILNRR